MSSRNWPQSRDASRTKNHGLGLDNKVLGFDRFGLGLECKIVENKRRTKLTAAVPQVLWVVIARVDSHPVRIDSRQEPFVVVYKILRARVGHAECGRLTQRTDVVAATCHIRIIRVALKVVQLKYH